MTRPDYRRARELAEAIAEAAYRAMPTARHGVVVDALAARADAARAVRRSLPQPEVLR